MIERTKRICVDCYREFDAYGPLQIRCPECQKKHRKEYDHKRHIKKKQTKKKPQTQSKVINGHVQVCRCITKCFYGQSKGDGCAYALEENKTRTSQGLYIVDGKCPAFREKTKGERLKRSEPKYCFERENNTREVYREFTEI